MPTRMDRHNWCFWFPLIEALCRIVQERIQVKRRIEVIVEDGLDDVPIPTLKHRKDGLDLLGLHSFQSLSNLLYLCMIEEGEYIQVEYSVVNEVGFWSIEWLNELLFLWIGSSAPGRIEHHPNLHTETGVNATPHTLPSSAITPLPRPVDHWSQSIGWWIQSNDNCTRFLDGESKNDRRSRFPAVVCVWLRME